jgi:hypothetical protein
MTHYKMFVEKYYTFYDSVQLFRGSRQLKLQSAAVKQSQLQ